MIDKFKKLFKTDKAIIGMIHLLPLPGTPLYRGSMEEIIEKALLEADIYKSAGIDGIAIENMHDVPYLNGMVGPEIVSSMAVVGREIKKEFAIPLGIQILAGANKEALAVAKSSNLDFVRCEGFVFAHVADEGIIESNAGEILRYRKMIGGEDIMVFTDIKKKHSSHSITDDVSIGDTAHAAEFFLSDGVIVTGSSTGKSADLDELKLVKETVGIPVIVGSGIDDKNIENFLEYSDGLIIGSYFKKDGYWKNELKYHKVKLIMDKVVRYRN